MSSGEEDTDLHTPAYSALESEAPQLLPVVGLLPYPGKAKDRLSNLIKFHNVEHLEEDAIDISVPSLVEMAITPMGDGRGLHLGIDLIHDGTFLVQIGDKGGIILYPRTDACLAVQNYHKYF